MSKLQSEKKELEAKLRELQQQKTPLDQVMAMAKKFIEHWQGLGELLQHATDDERRTFLEQFVEVVQFSPTSQDGKTGTYVLRLFPEAVLIRDSKNGAVEMEAHNANGDQELTGSPLVRQVDELAPRKQPSS